jgi:hypothetical protein
MVSGKIMCFGAAAWFEVVYVGEGKVVAASMRHYDRA